MLYPVLCMLRCVQEYPLSGGAFTYTMMNFGEFPAWLTACNLVLSFLTASAAVSVRIQGSGAVCVCVCVCVCVGGKGDACCGCRRSSSYRATLRPQTHCPPQ
jgi:hypothetical protein